jgi:hypothetical protein
MLECPLPYFIGISQISNIEHLISDTVVVLNIDSDTCRVPAHITNIISAAGNPLLVRTEEIFHTHFIFCEEISLSPRRENVSNDDRTLTSKYIDAVSTMVKDYLKDIREISCMESRIERLDNNLNETGNMILLDETALQETAYFGKLVFGFKLDKVVAERRKDKRISKGEGNRDFIKIFLRSQSLAEYFSDE